MQKQYSIKKRYRLLLPLMFVAWIMMMIQAMPHHHHSDARICMESPEAHCHLDQQADHESHHCSDELKPCNKHFDIEKPRLEQQNFKPTVQLLAILLDLEPDIAAAPTLRCSRARAPAQVGLYDRLLSKAIGLRAPPQFL